MIGFWIFAVLAAIFFVLMVLGVVEGKSYAIGGLLGLMIFGSIANGIYQDERFNKQFESGEITIETNVIELGGSGSPMQTTIPEVPAGSERIRSNPRLFSLDEGCTSLTTNDDQVTQIFAATNSVTPIQIFGPPGPGGSVNVCVEKGTADVVLWTN